MKKLALVVGMLVGALAAQAEEVFVAQATGTTAQTVIVGYGKKVCLSCTVDVRYRAGNVNTLQAATTSNAVPVATGDCYKVKLMGGNDRLSIIHKDGSTSFTCDVFAVEE